MDERPFFDINRRIDRSPAAAAFAAGGRVQVPDVLTPQSAAMIMQLLTVHTPWGLSWHDGTAARAQRAHELSATSADEHRMRAASLENARRARKFAFVYASYPLVDAYQKWDTDGPHDMLLEYINDEPMMNLVRAVTGMPDLVKADAQATLYRGGDFLAVHNDTHVAEGWRVAYVLSMCPVDWRPEWGGILEFYDDAGEVVARYRPGFNVLNLFLVPQPHAVSVVDQVAPLARYSITGWFRNR